jgi:hypothetical protein
MLDKGFNQRNGVIMPEKERESTETENVTIRMSKELKDLLNESARVQFISVSALLKQGAMLWLKNHGFVEDNAKLTCESVLAELERRTILKE